VGINFVGRTFENNGIQGKIQKREFEPNEPFSITATVIGNYKYVKFQTEPYYCSQNINKLTPKPIFKKWNYKIAYYIVTSVQKFVSLYDGQQGGYKLDDIKNHKIQLPIIDSDLDLKFMEEFINELEVTRACELETYFLATDKKDFLLTKEEEEPTHLVAHLHFLPTAQTNAKKSKRATKPTHQDSSKQWTTEQRQTERQLVTAPTQKAGFRVPKTVLWLIKH
jgi:hypothetical protein